MTAFCVRTTLLSEEVKPLLSDERRLCLRRQSDFSSITEMVSCRTGIFQKVGQLHGCGNIYSHPGVTLCCHHLEILAVFEQGPCIFMVRWPHKFVAASGCSGSLGFPSSLQTRPGVYA